MTAMGKVAVVAVFSVVSLVLSLLLSGRMLIRLPPDYFTSRRRPPPTSLWAKAGWNVLGAALVILVDFPGKRRLLLAVLRRGPVRAVVDRLRARSGRPPLEIPPGS